MQRGKEKTMTNSNRFEWTDDVVNRLRQLWVEGHATAEIGRRIGASKNAVVGKAHRLSLPGRPSPIAPDTKQPRRSSKTTTVPRVANLVPVPAPAPPPSTFPTPLPVRATVAAASAIPPKPAVNVLPSQPKDVSRSFGPRTNRTCCWPIGEPGTKTFRFCDAPVESRNSYCLDHARKAYLRRVEASQSAATSA
jgi:GcrA cell cycle regulator